MSTRRDQRIADEVDMASHLRCMAQGCPNPWSVDTGSRLCSAHAHADAMAWPRITQQILDADADRARAAAMRDPAPTRPPLTPEQRRAVGQKLRQMLQQRGGKAWAHVLRDREQRGERLTDAQRAMWRAAIGPLEMDPAS